MDGPDSPLSHFRPCKNAAPCIEVSESPTLEAGNTRGSTSTLVMPFAPKIDEAAQKQAQAGRQRCDDETARLLGFRGYRPFFFFFSYSSLSFFFSSNFHGP